MKVRARDRGKLSRDRIRAKRLALCAPIREWVIAQAKLPSSSQTYPFDNSTFIRFANGDVGSIEMMLKFFRAALDNGATFSNDYLALWKQIDEFHKLSNDESAWNVESFDSDSPLIKAPLDNAIKDMSGVFPAINQPEYQQALRLYIDELINVASGKAGLKVPFSLAIPSARERTTAKVRDGYLAHLATPWAELLSQFQRVDTTMEDLVCRLAQPGTPSAKSTRLMNFVIDLKVRI